MLCFVDLVVSKKQQTSENRFSVTLELHTAGILGSELGLGWLGITVKERKPVVSSGVLTRTICGCLAKYRICTNHSAVLCMPDRINWLEFICWGIICDWWYGLTAASCTLYIKRNNDCWYMALDVLSGSGKMSIPAQRARHRIKNLLMRLFGHQLIQMMSFRNAL